MPVFLEEVTLNELRLQGCLLTADDTMRLSIAVLCLPLSQQNAYLFTTFTCQCLRLLHLITESGPNDTLDIFRVVELFLDLSRKGLWDWSSSISYHYMHLYSESLYFFLNLMIFRVISNVIII